jgi:adenosine deaminase
MRPETLAELAATYDMEVPVIRGFGSFPVFSQMYRAACEVLQTPEDLARLVTETIEDQAADGAVWFEPAFWPIGHISRLGTEDEIFEIALEAAAKASATTGVGVGWMITADRTLSPAEAVAQAELAVRYADRGVVSFGLANDEALWPPEPFAEAFAIAKDAGLLSTPHAGELAGPESVIGALDVLHADRLEHGVRAIEDPALVQRLADEGICIDVCPSSNILLSVFPSIEEHPLPTLLEAGVRCSLNADDPLLFGPGLLDEYELVRTKMGLDDDAMASIARSSIECSGAPAALKAEAVAGIDAWLATPA